MSRSFAILLFGVPTLNRSSPPMVFTADRPFQLLAYLACRRSWVSRDELAEWLRGLWTEGLSAFSGAVAAFDDGVPASDRPLLAALRALANLQTCAGDLVEA